MIFNRILIHQRKWAALFIYIFSIQLAVPCLANAKYVYITPFPNGNLYASITKSDSQPVFTAPHTDANAGAAIANFSSNSVNHFRKAANKKGPGPGQPEQKSFQSVNAQNMVDLFSGDFSYNIPLLDVGGYPVNIHYRSGITMDQEASWVGLGWNLQPGSVNRNMRGLPDDFNGDTVVKTEFSKPNWTAGVNLGFAPEIAGLPDILGLSFNAGMFYNNHRGIGFETGINASLTASKGAQGGLNGGIGINLSNNSQNGFSVEPSFDLNNRRNENCVGGILNGLTIGAAFSTRTGMKDVSFSMTGSKRFGDQAKDWTPGSGFGGSISFAHQAYTPKMSVPFTSYQFNFSLKLGGEFIIFHPLASIGGYYSSQSITGSDTTLSSRAYGYANLQNGYANQASLLDFNREKELPAYSADPPTPHLAIPNYTYDIYSVTGEGAVSVFRPYRGDIGFVRDPLMQSKAGSAGASVDLGFGDIVHAGIDALFSYTTTSTGGWQANNTLINQTIFKNADSSFENVYFRNPNEKTSNAQTYYDQTGDTRVLMPVMTPYDDPSLTPFMQPYLNQKKNGSALNFDGKVLKTARDKRSQMITIMKASDAALFGLDKQIQNYAINTFTANDNCLGMPNVSSEQRFGSFRKPYHFSEITVLNDDGKRYIYGLPTYNLDQEEVSFSADKNLSNMGSGGNLVGYPAQDNSIKNQTGKDHFYVREKIPAFASSFLITGLLSPDYVDRTGDGITDDDQGDAVKFAYSKMYGYPNPYKWRTPFGPANATYQEGLKTDKSDDKGSYIYGTKEIWYLNSIVTKTMIATFTLNDTTTEKRQDGYGVANENGGIDLTHSLRYLKQIDLYSKQDYQNYSKTGRLPKPIKTVHFVYSYTLCTNAPGSNGGVGKLTLDSIWFSYNGSKKAHQNAYVFKYNSNNPSYNSAAADRWGTYKSSASNPSGLSNADYPYSLQDSISGWDSTKAALNAGAWNLDSIKLPSTGTIKINYESDDYAYVQNKRATQMMQVAGFSNTSTYSANADLYYKFDPFTPKDYDYVFIRVPKAVANRTDAYQKYLDGIDKIYFAYQVKMPSDIYGSGNEKIAVYAQFDNYGTTTDKYVIWVHLKSAENSGTFVSPLAKAAIQFLRLNLPSKAFPGSDLNGDFSFTAMGKALIGYMMNFGELVSNFAYRSRINGNAKTADLTTSFARLDNPAYKKLGGGLRVKRITISDNFSPMTGLQQQTAVYGQEYDYSTLKTINGVPTRISSGVAAWEPAIGNEENPFRLPIEYDVQISALAPTNNMYSEYPLGEGYFPSAQVGYSKVRVHTLNNKVISANGYEESEFYTAYDFPTITEQTPLDDRRVKPSILAQLFKINAKSYLSQTQGFKVEINDMNGKPKATASYPENDPYSPVSFTKYFYQTDNDSAVFKHLNNTVSVVDSASGHVNPAAQIGKDIELMIDTREELTQTKGIDIEFNTDAFVIGIIPMDVSMVWPFPQWESERYRSAATMKLIQRYGILNKVQHYEKGSLITTENLLFDAETGDVVLTRTKNEFEDSVYQFNYPAHWAYSGMEPAYKNTADIFTSLEFRDGKIVTGSKYPSIENYFESGDELIVKNIFPKSGSTGGPLSCGGEGTCATPNYAGAVINLRLWAVDAAKFPVHGALSGIYFLDKDGNFFTGKNTSSPDTIIISRSGKRNMAATSVGTVQSMSSPLRLVAGKWKLVFDDQTRIVNTSASSFKDSWKIENVILNITPPDTISRSAGTHTAYFFPDSTNANFTIANDFYWSTNPTRTLTPYVNQDFFESAQFNHGSNSDDMGVYSFMKFKIPSTPQFTGDTNYLPTNAFLGFAWLNLWPHLENHPSDGSHGEKFHTATDPHKGTTGADFSIARITDPTFNSINYATLPTASQATLQGMLGMTVDNVTKISVPKTGKQNSLEVDITGLFSQMYANPTQPKALEIWPANSSATESRICFFAKNTCVLGGSTNECPIDQNGPGIDLSVPGQKFSSCQVGNHQFNCDVRPYMKVSYSACPSGITPTQVCDSVFCITTKPGIMSCKSVITDTTVNPYLYGALGNWRMNRAYVYYDNRKETDPTLATDIRNNGTIISYQSYWTFAATGKMTTATDSTIWVWNTESTMFNKRGLELENRNALNIYSAAQYGYNQSLPVAVTQNALYREQAYDGLEDYKFRNATLNCQGCAVKRHIDIDNVLTILDSTIAHTGKYSLKVSPGSTVKAHASVSAPLDTVSKLIMLTDTIVSSQFSITPAGTGLNDTVYSYGTTGYNNDVYGLDKYSYYRNGVGPFKLGTTNVRYDVSGTSNVLGLAQNWADYKVVWSGYYMADVDFNTIYFKADVTNSVKVWIDSTIYLNRFSNDPKNAMLVQTSTAIHSWRAKIYKIRVEHTVGHWPANVGRLYLNWGPVLANIGANDSIPRKYLYPTYAAANAALHRVDVNCVNFRGIKQTNLLIKDLSLTAGSQMVVSGWVYENQDCHCNSYTHGNISVTFRDGTGNIISTTPAVLPSGNIIDKWQRIETVVTVPANAFSLDINMNNNNSDGKGTIVNFDDLRVHPFNANMKSYVYDDINLRLMADLDENNYASFYEYDEDGSLVRVKKETEQGIKTIKETRNALVRDTP